MNARDRELALKATTQMALGKGIFTTEREFKEWFCKENNITDLKLTQIVRDLLDGK